jgi:choline dehydrogenase-like flavoprotein
MGFGATQAYEVPLTERRLKLESLSLPPELLAARLPGAGGAWQERLQNLDHYAQWATIVRMQARGKVRSGLFGGPRVRFEPTREDFARVQEGVALLARMMFAAGAVEVYPGVAGAPEVMTDPSQIDAITSSARTRRDFHLMASHHFASAAAGAEVKHAVVDEQLRCHDTEGLYVMDASVLPENLGVNPQHTIMAVSFRAAEQLAA